MIEVCVVVVSLLAFCGASLIRASLFYYCSSVRFLSCATWLARAEWTAPRVCVFVLAFHVSSASVISSCVLTERAANRRRHVRACLRARLCPRLPVPGRLNPRSEETAHAVPLCVYVEFDFVRAFGIPRQSVLSFFELSSRLRSVASLTDAWNSLHRHLQSSVNVVQSPIRTHVSQSGCGRCRSVELVFYDVLLSYVFVRCIFRVGFCRLRFGGLSALVRRRVLSKLSLHLRRFCLHLLRCSVVAQHRQVVLYVAPHVLLPAVVRQVDLGCCEFRVP